jgi:hypothetical protein
LTLNSLSDQQELNLETQLLIQDLSGED